MRVLLVEDEPLIAEFVGKGLRESGHDVTLAISRGSRWEPLARQLTGVRVETFTPKSPIRFAMVRTLIRLIRECDAQILHAHQGCDYWPAITASRLANCGTRVVVTRHLMTRPRNVSRALLLRLSDVIAVSGAVEEVLQRELRGPPERLHRIYGGIDNLHPHRRNYRINGNRIADYHVTRYHHRIADRNERHADQQCGDKSH